MNIWNECKENDRPITAKELIDALSELSPDSAIYFKFKKYAYLSIGHDEFETEIELEGGITDLESGLHESFLILGVD